jgi:RimJ/RimL family protein N-acetyltransferase
MYHPFLVGRKIYLRGLEDKDLSGEYFQWFNDMDTCRYNSHAVFPNSEKSMCDYFESLQGNRNIIVFAIIEKKTDRHVGNVSLQNIDWISRNAEIAFIISAKHSGKGYGYEAGVLVIGHAFERLNLIRVYCGTSAENIAMQKLAVRLGMKKEGVRRQAMFKTGRYVDMYEFGIVRKGKTSG